MSDQAPPRRHLNAIRGRAAMTVAVLCGLVASAVIVWQASYSSFSSTSSNGLNSWSTGSVVLSDDRNGVALFTVNGLKPGASGSRCIQVTSTGSLPSTVKLYASATPAYAQTNGVGDNVAIAVTQGTGAGADCAAFVALSSGATVLPALTLTSFASTYTNFNNGAGSWSPTGTSTESRVYRFDYTFSAGAPNTTQNGTASIGFTWEAQNS